MTAEIILPTNTYVKNAYVMKANIDLLSLALYVVDDSDLADVRSKLLIYTQTCPETNKYIWSRDVSSNIEGLLMNDVQPMELDINGD